MDKSTFIPKHQTFKTNLISSTLIVLAIISNVHFTRSNELDFELVRDGAISVFKFKNLVNNILPEKTNQLFIAGTNYVYLLNDSFFEQDRFMKKAFYSEPKNEHLIPFEFKEDSLKLLNYLSTILPNKLDCSSFNQSDCTTDPALIQNDNKLFFKLKGDHTTDSTENDNKIIFKLRKDPSFFMICGTAYNGQCFIAIVSNKILIKDIFTSERFDLIASRNSNFLMRVDHGTYFILAHEPDGRNESLRLPILSKIKLKNYSEKRPDDKKFSFEPEVHDSLKSMINIADQNILNKTKIHFIHGFIYENYAFILKREQKFGQAPTTRLGRVCLADTSFFSYTEIVLTCNDDKMKVFNYATSATFGEADSYIAKEKDIKLKKNTLFVTFNYYDNRMKRVDTTKGSTLCAFTMEQINDYYLHAIEVCYSGSQAQNVGLMIQYSAVPKTTDVCTRVKKGDNYVCYGNSINSYVEYRENLPGFLLYTLKSETITSLTSTIIDRNLKLNTFVLGTNDGKIIKLARAYDNKLHLTHTFKMGNQSKNQINPNPYINDKMVYLTSGKHLIKYPMSSCSIYSTCKQCLKALDNLLCGWCSIENQNAGGCLNEQECKSLGGSHLYEVAFNVTKCPPIIEDFSPKLGPVEGNTEIQLKGENLCTSSKNEYGKNYKVNVTIGEHYCNQIRCKDDSLFCKTTKIQDSFLTGAIKICTHDKSNEDYEIEGCSTSLDPFNFTRTEVFKIEPKFGPIGGGTKITLFGKNLNSGKKRVVKIKESDCLEIAVDNTYLECITQGILLNNDDAETLKEINQNGVIILEIDGNKYELDGSNKSKVDFEFKPNPTVIDYSPRTGLRNADIHVIIHGQYFASAHRLQLKTTFTSAKREFELFGKCTMTNNSTLNCTIPQVPPEVEIKSAKSPLLAEVTLVPDGGDSKNLKSNKINFFYYPLPKFNANFSGRSKALISGSKGVIKLYGDNLSDQYPLDIKLIKLDKESFNTTSIEEMKLTDEKLYCREIKVNRDCNQLTCNVDLSKESIDQVLYDNLWLVKIEIEKEDPIKVQLVQFEKGDLAVSKVSKITIISWIIFSLIILFSAFYVCYLYRNERLKFSKEKKFPHFNVTFNNGTSMNNPKSMLDSPFNRQSSQNEYHNTNQPLLGIQTENKLSKLEQFKTLLAQDNILIPYKCLEFGNKIGTGFFGCVYKGVLKLPTKKPLEVAIKTLKNENPDAFQSLLDEAMIMKDFKNENVLTLVGVCLKEDSSLPMIILPFMANGDLLTYIRSESNFPTVKNLLYFAIDVGKGMSYLSSLKYVHRDLAARNCMMDQNLRIKVADFGLTRDVYERNYYTSNQKGEIPIKWMSPESIEKNLTTVESDVWSYGVLLWELMTRGNVPYPTLEGYRVLDFIKSDQRMAKPDTCPNEIYELMLDCWQIVPRLRPSFDKIVERIKTLIQNKDEEISIYSNLTVNYVNYPVEQYYSNNRKRLEQLDNQYNSPVTSPYYNSSLSLKPSVLIKNTVNNTANSSINPTSTAAISTNNLSNPLNKINKMSTFKSPKIIEMPGKQFTFNNVENQNDLNDATLKMPLKDEETPTHSRKNSNNSTSNLSIKLNRQNAIDLNEADTRHYEYVVQTPQILIQNNKPNKELNDEVIDKESINLKNFDNSNNYVHPVKYFK